MAGKPIDGSLGAATTCTVDLPYPARRCGRYEVRCKACGSARWIGAMDRQIVEEEHGRRFVKVRVPVIVDADGSWTASGLWSRDAKQAAGEVAAMADCLNFDHVRRVYFLYALVPVPDADTMPVIGCEAETR